MRFAYFLYFCKVIYFWRNITTRIINQIHVLLNTADRQLINASQQHISPLLQSPCVWAICVATHATMQHHSSNTHGSAPTPPVFTSSQYHQQSANAPPQHNHTQLSGRKTTWLCYRISKSYSIDENATNLSFQFISTNAVAISPQA